MADDHSAEASLVDQLNAVEKAAVLDALLGSQPDLKPAVERLAAAMPTPVAGASVAEDLIADLDHLSMEEFANRSGRRHGGGYTEPTQAAWEMVEEVIERHLAELDRWVRLGRFEDAKLTCIGVLTGLYEYRTPKNGTVMSWANGAADELARQTLARTRLAGVEVDDTDLRGLFSDWLVDP